MNARRAKALRKKVYGEDFSPRERNYNDSSGIRMSDSRRQLYQQEKKNWKKRKSSL